ncbi:MAG: SDR family NAD(P)-dependent oxidoreductase, partial [Bacteroidota bacterium]
MALTVVITGASRGIGKALAQHFAAAGYELLLSARNADGVEATVKALREQFP